MSKNLQFIRVGKAIWKKTKCANWSGHPMFPLLQELRIILATQLYLDTKHAVFVSRIKFAFWLSWTCMASSVKYTYGYLHTRESAWQVWSFDFLHLIGFSDLVFLYKRKKPMILCALVRQYQVNRERNTVQTARAYWTFVCSVVKITRLYEYQTWQTRFCGNSRDAQRLMGFFLLTVIFECWLAKRQTPITWLFL